jgi:hypothetical protein
MVRLEEPAKQNNQKKVVKRGLDTVITIAISISPVEYKYKIDLMICLNCKWRLDVII